MYMLMQLYVTFKPTDSADLEKSLKHIQDCVQELNFGMASNYFKLNDDKTEMAWSKLSAMRKVI